MSNLLPPHDRRLGVLLTEDTPTMRNVLFIGRLIDRHKQKMEGWWVASLYRKLLTYSLNAKRLSM